MKKILLFGILMLFLGFGQAFGALIDITATEDLYYSGTTITNSGELQVGRTDRGAVMYTTLLKFAIPANSVITSAVLYLHKTGGRDGGGVGAYYASDGWNESSIAIPSGTVTTTLLGENPTNGGQFDNSYLSWVLGLTPDMISDGVLSIALVEFSGDSAENVRYHVFNSSEALGNRPYLRLNYTTVPIPPTAYLLGVGFFGFVGLRKRFRY
jgi:hypothetical protein